MSRYVRIERHPCKDDVDALLLAGWSPDKIAEHLKARFPDVQMPSVRALWYYRKRHPELNGKALLKTALMAETGLRRIPFEVDVMEKQKELLVTAESRVARALEWEAKFGGTITKGGTDTMGQFQKSVEVLDKMLVRKEGGHDDLPEGGLFLAGMWRGR